MFLVDTTTNQQQEGLIEPITPEELKIILKEKQFQCDWKTFKKQELYKIRLKSSELALGLMAIKEHTKDGLPYLEIAALETILGNLESTKLHQPLAGYLIAYACREAFKRGFNGFVALIPKPTLFQTYIDTYGFMPAGKRVYTDFENSARLIRRYLGND